VLRDNRRFFVILAAINAGQMTPEVVDYLKQAVSSLREALEKQKRESEK
jgi:hypothetical protein